MERHSFLKRRGDFAQPGDSKKAKKGDEDSVGGPKKMTFAERMMAKQGWKAGEGLGKEKSGIINPIQVQLRPTGAGVGAIKEKSAQQKREERRQAEGRGEKYEDSSEEERKALRKNNRKVAGVSTRSGGRVKQKSTVIDIPEGMHVPASLHELIDLTGEEAKLLAPSTLSLGAVVPEETRAPKIARRARQDLVAYVSASNDLAEEYKTTEYQLASLAQELKEIELEIARQQHITTATAELRSLQTWDDVVAKLVDMDVDNLVDPSTAVAAVHPFFKGIMSTWEPLEDTLDNIIADLRKISAMSSPPQDRNRAENSEKIRSKSTTPYETMLIEYYLPRMRTAIINWNPQHETLALVGVLAAWNSISPVFIQNGLLKQVTTKLSSVVYAWSPRKSIKKKLTSELPDLVTPWLSFLHHSQTDPKSPSGLVSDVKRKFRALVDAWDLSRGVIPEVVKWRQLLGSEFDRVLLNHLMPKLSTYFDTEFELNPADQDLESLSKVLEWQPLFSASTIGQLLAIVFFDKKLMPVLHLWLRSDGASYQEIGAWYSWLKDQVLPADINNVPAVAEKWEQALGMINQALDLGERAKTDLQLPADGDRALPETPRLSTIKEPAAAPKVVEEATFRDVVESWCEEENIFLRPLREAHEITGSPLFRLTASVSGKGGVRVYLKGDVLYAQNKKDRSLWEPMGLEERLVQRAEGK